MSSHREAPEISQDPVADNTDCYAFVSPDKPDTVTIITNYVPLEDPPGGPNFFEFGDDVRYSIYVDNDGDGKPEIEYQFRFKTKLRNPDTFLYNTGQITALNSQTWNRRQFYEVTKVNHKRGKSKVLGSDLASPPCNIGPRSTPNYPKLAKTAVHRLDSGERVFAGQRNEGFFVDLGSIFDLGDLRPLQNLHLIATSPAMGVDATATLNVHTIAIQIPIKKLTRDRSVPSDPMSAKAVLGIWGAASRRKTRVLDKANDEHAESGPWVQVSRLGNPLFNEVVVPMGSKDKWNAVHPAGDKAFAKYVEQPELAKLLPVLYPGVFPRLAKLKAKRADLVAILLTGIPKGIIPGFQNYTGSVLADMMRLNVAIPPTKSKPSPLGLLGGDAAGFPNGRRVFDDVVNIELQAIAGLTYPLVNPDYKPDDACSAITQGLTPGKNRYQSTFPYLGTPHNGFDTPAGPKG
ncbi:MAG TPA: DUF4331 domain-containing protein [Solirubrobacterales bacterium]|jgi:hypothetical protein|nr:DUF4331 domain-containing protein [Solirubrobacterales bacterium]